MSNLFLCVQMMIGRSASQCKVHMVEVVRGSDAITNHGFQWTIDAFRVLTKEGAV